MAECKVCGKALNQEVSSIGSWCIDCIKSMSGKNTVEMESFKSIIKKEKLLIMIFAAIGAVGGLVLGPSAVSGGNFSFYDDLGGDTLEMIGYIIGFIWCSGGLGAALGYFICRFTNALKNARARGEEFGQALKGTLFAGLVFLVLGFLGGAIFFLVLILRRNSWIKKYGAIIASENATIAELDGYTLGKDINTTDLSRKVNIIVDNHDVVLDGFLLDDLKQLQIVQ